MILSINGPLGQFLTSDFQEEALGWYKLPEEMLGRLIANPPVIGDAAPLPAEEFVRVRAAVAQYAAESVAAFNPAYHNIDHFEKHAKASVMLFDACISGGDNDARLAMRQLIELAGLMHDAHHPCSTLRADSPQERWHKPELGAEVTCEFVSALSAVELFAQLGLGLAWQMGVTYLIWSTTFGHADAANRGFDYVPNVFTPNNPLFTVMRLADIWPTGDATDGLMDGVHVNMLETCAKGVRTSDPMEIIIGQRGFESYRQLMIAHLTAQVTRGHDLLERGMNHSREMQSNYSMAASGNWPELVAFTASYIDRRSV